MPTIEELRRGLRPPEDAWLGNADLGRIRREGGRLRQRRRLAVTGAVGAVAACTAAVALLVPGALSDGPSSRTDPGVAQAPDDALSDTALVAQCRQGEITQDTTDRLFGSGDPTVQAVVRTRHQARLALESADGKYWADCFVNLDQQEFASGMTVYPIGGTSAGLQYGSGPGCGLVGGNVDASCGTFWTSWVDRRPAAVAAAEVTTADGVTTTVPSRNGYLVLNHLGKLPDGVEMTENGLPMRFEPISRITFLDADGRPLASESQDGSGRGPDGEQVKDLPPLSAYPGRYGDPLY